MQGMSETITPRRFHEVDWRVGRNDASTHFRTGSFAVGLALVDAIGELADAANHHPDVDLRSDGVTVRLRPGSDGRLSERDIALARQISEVARELDVPIDLTGLQGIRVAIDAMVIPDVLPFSSAVLGYEQVDDADLIDPAFRGRRSGSSRWTRRAQRNRIHIDVCLPVDQAEARIAAALAADGHLVSDANARSGGRWPTRRATRSTVAPWPDRD
jgi:4a-hydroxytetrahydrobiopterin dehydratase